MTTRLAVYISDPAHQWRAQQLALRLTLPCLTEKDSTIPFLLLFDEQGRLSLQATQHAYSPLCVDFVHGALAHRYRCGINRREPLARAVGVKAGYRPRILDLSAGLGRDAFLLASLGCHVTLLERSPIIAALLDDGLERARCQPNLRAICDRLPLTCSDAEAFLNQAPTQLSAFDTVYFDPMFPTRPTSAKVKRDMQCLHAFLGTDDAGAKAVVQTTLAHLTQQRLVVKRPRWAPALASTPKRVLKTPGLRYDIW